jgi:ABC-2 type transport system ATP-binding protein
MRLAFAVAIHVDLDVLLVDEVLAVGDEAFRK